MSKRKIILFFSNYWFFLPSVAVLLGLVVYPAIYNILLSFQHKVSPTASPDFIGFSNYVYILQKEEFWRSLRNGLVYAFASVSLQLLLGLFCAQYISKMRVGKRLMQSVLLIPYFLPTVVVIIVWKWIFNYSFGIANYMLESFGIQSVNWLDTYLMVVLIFTSVWQFFPFVLVLLLARMGTISESLYRSARIDGASQWQVFIYITLPQLRKVLLGVTLLRALWMFTKFDTVWLLGGTGGASSKVQNLPVFAYRLFFSYTQFGLGAAVTILLLLIALISIFSLFRGSMSTSIQESK